MSYGHRRARFREITAASREVAQKRVTVHTEATKMFRCLRLEDELKIIHAVVPITESAGEFSDLVRIVMNLELSNGQAWEG